ncbi:hypothetical protein F7725_012640 [Dissostichus mawsoni]|uniref:P2X purinoceptor n=1 Tax=Dissostichus mawsoni TaxID=36200 RepID=A0A7J5YRE5_DISMA|nr:hypothetical protein F7725_012640 [Dissostichus mawsoni]
MCELFHKFMMGLRDFVKDYFLGFWDYETPKVMVVQNKTLGVIYRGVQYVFISEKAYQESETRPESSVYTLMKGTAVHGDDILDTVEYVRPSEHFMVANANCTRDSDCVQGEVDFDGHEGPADVQYYNHTFKTCEIQTWCPIERYAVVREPALVEAINFTVFIRNSIHFPGFKVLRGNIKDISNPKEMRRFLNKCHYDKETIRTVQTFAWATSQLKLGRTSGGVIGVFINWNCNLDLDYSYCQPTYSFRRLDLRKDQASSGYYYRFAKYYRREGVESRTLIKAYGIRLDVIVHGHAGKFSPIPTIISTVTAMTSVGICTIICDWIMLTFIDKNEVYSDRKFDEVTTAQTTQTCRTVYSCKVHRCLSLRWPSVWTLLHQLTAATTANLSVSSDVCSSSVMGCQWSLLLGNKQ